MRRVVPIIAIVALVLVVIVIGTILARGRGETATGAPHPGDMAEESETAPSAPVATRTPLASPTPGPTSIPFEYHDPFEPFVDERSTPTDAPPTPSATATDETAVPAPAPTEAIQTPPSEPAESPPIAASGAVSAAIADPIYLADGRWAEVYITVTNLSVSPFLRTGYEYVQPNPDGGPQRVTLLMVIQEEVPQPIISGEPLWLGHTRFSDGTRWTFPVGCLYIEDVFAEGMEGDFHWEAHYTGGFFDCGNSTDKIVPPIAPGQTATIPLYVYLQHPRLWLTEPPPGRSISQIDLEVFDAYGNSLGIVASRGFGP